MRRSNRDSRLSRMPSLESQASMRQRLREDPEELRDEQNLPQVQPPSPVRSRLLMICLLVGFFFSLLDTTIVSTSLLASSNDLKGFRDGSWVVLAYLLSYMGFSIVLAKLSDIYGRRLTLLASWLTFGIFSVACGCALTMTQLIICRALQGIGGAGLYSLTTISLPEIAPPQKHYIIGPLIGVTISLSFVLGPILGGVIPEFASWRLIYWINAPFCLLITFGLVFLYPSEHHRTARPGSLRRIDFLGSILLLAATVLMVFALQQAGSQVYAWSSTTTVSMLTVSTLCFAAFCAWETWLSISNRRIEPLFPLRLVTKRVYMACLVAKFLIGYVYLTLVLTLPERFQIVNGDSFWTAGLHLLPMLGGTGVGCFLNGPINKEKNRTSVMAVVSCVLVLIGTGLFTTMQRATTNLRPQYGFQAIFGLGVGLFFSAATMMSTAQAPKGDHAAAQGAISQARVLGGAIGLAIFTIIWNNTVQAELVGELTSDQLYVLHQSPTAVVERWPETQGLIRESYAEAFASMTRNMTAVAAAALFVSVFTLEKNPPLINGNFTEVKEVPASRSNSDVGLDDIGSEQSVVDFTAPKIPVPTLAPRARSQV